MRRPRPLPRSSHICRPPRSAQWPDYASWVASTDHGVPPHEAPTALADARAYIRLVGDDGIAYFRAANAEQAAQAVLSRRRKPLAEQDFEQLTRRSEECEQSLPQQGVPGVRASTRATEISAILLVTAFVVMAGWVVVALFSSAEYHILFTEPYGMLVTFLEVMFLTPWVMLPFFALFHAMMSWKGRVHGRAALRWAKNEPSTHGLGIPTAPPFSTSHESWDLLRMYMLAALYVSVIPLAFLGMWAFADGDLNAGLGAAIIYVLPVIAVHLLAGRRAAVFDRREKLLQHLLYRSPGLHPDSELSPDHVELVEHDIDMSWSDELADQDGEWREDGDRDEERVRRDLPSDAGDAGWTSGFSAAAPTADHLVDPVRFER